MPNNTMQIVNQIRDLFFSKLKEKTGWGYLEIQKLYSECEREVILNTVNQYETAHS